ncbi:MAG: ATP-binding cassette domain-containing protein [Oscillospiraceae bacterium]
MLIDEPTNHLDAAGRQTVAEYLRKKQGFLLVSHDRAFLDGCVDHILALNKTGVSVKSGTFSTWWEKNPGRMPTSRHKMTNKGEMKRLAQAAKRTSTWSDRVEATKTALGIPGLRPDRGYIGHRSAKMMQRAKSIDTRRQKALEEASWPVWDLERAESLKRRPLTARGRLLDLREVVPHYGGRPVCRPLTFALEPGDRVALTGGNGCGKSTLLKLLMGQEISWDGTFTHLPGLSIPMFPKTPVTSEEAWTPLSGAERRRNAAAGHFAQVGLSPGAI